MENRRKKRRKIDKKKKLILVLDGVLLVGLIIAAIVLATTLSGKGSGETVAAKPAAEQPEEGGGLLSAISAIGKADGNASEAASVAPASAETQTAAVEGGAADAMHIDFTKLSNEGTPAVAYICSEGTPVNYPVVQHIDNEYYMARNSNGKKDENGAIFLDCRNSNEFLDEQVVIFGNPMADGSMFGSLVSYSDPVYLQEHPSLYLYTPGGNYRIDVFAAHTASPTMTNYPIWFADAAERANYIEAAKAQSVIKPDVAIADDAKLVCLVTSSDFDSGANTRFVVHGVLTQV